MYLRKKLSAIVMASAIVLSGCVTLLAVNYSPSSTMTVSGGGVQVAPFAYLPTTTGTVKPNEIRKTSIFGPNMFDQNIDVLVRDAVFKELRFVGIKVNDQGKKLSGEIQEFLIDYQWGGGSDWTLRVKYFVTGPSGITYEAVKEIKRNTTDVTNVLNSLNETIKLNVEELLKDPAFVLAIQ